MLFDAELVAGRFQFESEFWCSSLPVVEVVAVLVRTRTSPSPTTQHDNRHAALIGLSESARI